MPNNDAIPERKFLVVGRDGHPGRTVLGVDELAKIIGTSDIPTLKLYKYTVGEFTVYELNRN